MPINIPLLNEQTPQTVLKMIKLEASQLSLPDSRELMWGAFGAYAVLQAIAQAFNHSVLGSLLYGALSAGILYGATYGLLRVLKEDAKFQRTATALAIMGALAALAYIILHLVFGIALPPPLPTEKLLRFLLFPILIWMVFMYAFLFRHVSLRPVPAFVAASFYVIVIEVILSPICR
ncbi:hypothetical protein [Methylocystis sp. B8]|uniref:hypothetical protein n=1 Tax=Methylocystis sp. B8 TaxID=544938 RepID=UPI0010FDF5D0|nr:hypothetical protein [Methylocystis sp. B8]TLG76957.1 hypothetical protein FEV16_09490 [Methylocystis sp. B8]